MWAWFPLFPFVGCKDIFRNGPTRCILINKFDFSPRTFLTRSWQTCQKSRSDYIQYLLIATDTSCQQSTGSVFSHFQLQLDRYVIDSFEISHGLNEGVRRHFGHIFDLAHLNLNILFSRTFVRKVGPLIFCSFQTEKKMFVSFQICNLGLVQHMIQMILSFCYGERNDRSDMLFIPSLMPWLPFSKLWTQAALICSLLSKSECEMDQLFSILCCAVFFSN